VKEKGISTLNELLGVINDYSNKKLINDYSNKKLFFRGENKDYKESSCLPSKLRPGNNGIVSISAAGDKDYNWFTEKLKSLGIGIPYWTSNDNSDDGIITRALLNTPSWAWRMWDEEKVEALMKHYKPDFEALKGLVAETDLERCGASFLSAYLDVTPDIVTAIHFACSEFSFYQKGMEVPSEAELSGDGYLFVFDLNEIENARYLKLVNLPSYAYFYKEGEEYRYQPFDRITHQRGAFLAPKKDESNVIDYDMLSEEIKGTYLREKIILKNGLKKELFEVFGGKAGLDYYFPKIKKVLPSAENGIRKAYDDLQGITLMEKGVNAKP